MATMAVAVAVAVPVHSHLVLVVAVVLETTDMVTPEELELLIPLVLVGMVVTLFALMVETAELGVLLDLQGRGVMQGILVAEVLQGIQ
jgi:RsiW-degrading membrane proteinase PrsW (M82 family)